MILRQLFDSDSSTYSCLLAGTQSRQAVIVDPVREHARRDLGLLKELGLDLVYILETHVHTDHVTGANALKQVTGAQTGVSRHCGASGFDQRLNDGDVIEFRGETGLVIATPGHTPGSSCFLWRDRLLTGDTLLIGVAVARTFSKAIPACCTTALPTGFSRCRRIRWCYPGHDYKGRRVSTIAEEKYTNSRLAGRTWDQFIEFMNNLDLPMPGKIDEAVSANLRGGRTNE